ncbi:NAD(P)-dependent oxidoreductase [Streptomyces sp. SL13]|uniref:NAD(P)-dependent oxidoreductase n=1 Tax=Streptantibioticus silvisoli TaxID=2705255 RepID=A0AA90H4A0_9ACTN|nr:NAD(P)-dependent oxidoreductase [Streptantibioticus silvisoli]MDI5963970.1 NAD(P)-dependent oxidoreductase [Streptantibioticus silvisoli]MDI5970067.1 NAD(P)-dependent oxidoreductase [Streptantibioticus silvisoli]
MKTIVTGGSGFLGSTIAQYLLDEGHEVVQVDLLPPGSKGLLVDAEHVRGDVRDTDLMAKVFAGADEVYHLAGVLGTAELQETTHEAIDINIGGTVTVFEQATAAGVPRVFYPGKPNVWLNTYTVTKSAAEQFAAMFNAAGGDTRIMSLRLFNAYGPGQALLPIRKIVPAFAAQAKLGYPIEIWGDGEQIVDMVFSRDLADQTVRFTRAERTDVLPDCGSGVPISVNDVCAAVNAYFGNTAGVRHLPMRPGETPHTVLTADITDLTTVLGDLRLSDWQASLAESLDWYGRLDESVLAKAEAFYGWRH